MRECLWLVSQGVPFDVAFELDPMKRAAYSIIFSEIQGARFNFATMQFDEDK